MHNYNEEYIKKCLRIFDFNTHLEIPYEINKFPDGQVQFKIHKKYIGQYQIYVSIYNSIVLDLFYQIIQNFDVKSIKINYLYGARCDKSESGDYYVANIAYNFIETMNSFNANIDYLAPHCLEYIKEVNFDLPKCVDLNDYDLVIYPDESAQKRYEKINKPFIICKKHRDQETGKILSHVIPNLPDGVKRVIVMDDLGDGLATFFSVKNGLPDYVKTDLFIFHGVFSGEAIPKVFNYYENVFVSNSLPHVQEKADILHQWKTHNLNYKQACEQLGVKDTTQYENFIPGNLIIFDVWNNLDQNVN